jgi:integrase
MTREPKEASTDAHFRAVAGEGRNEFEGSARAPNTWKAYASTIGVFQAWCATQRLRSLPAKPETVKRWIVDLARQGYTSSTIRTYVAGLATWHKLQGRPFDRQPLAETLRGITRRSGPPARARPLLREDLAGILWMLDPELPADCRDGALLSIGWAAALRRVEIVGLDWQRRGAGSDATGILHATPEGLTVELIKSKTSQEAPVTIDVPMQHMPAAVHWVSLWVAKGRIKSGTPLFRQVGGSVGLGMLGGRRLSDHTAAEIVRKRAMAYWISQGAEPDDALARALDFSGHSLRAGYVTSAALMGTPEYLIRQRSRHKSAEVVAGYVRAAETKQQHGLGKVGI